LPVTYVVNPTGSGLDSEFVLATVSAAGETWDIETKSELVSDTIDLDSAADFDAAFDGRNEVSFGDYPTDGVIAVCRMWGYFSGRPRNREIVGFDLMFDTDYEWGNADTTSSVMDLQNIAAHELGHGIAGLDDIYDGQWTELTMYGYASIGETKKRALGPGDIRGLEANYGK
jgi:hypothetical protein